MPFPFCLKMAKKGVNQMSDKDKNMTLGQLGDALMGMLGLPSGEEIRQDLVVIGMFDTIDIEKLNVLEQVSLIKSFHSFAKDLRGIIQRNPECYDASKVMGKPAGGDEK